MLTFLIISPKVFAMISGFGAWLHSFCHDERVQNPSQFMLRTFKRQQNNKENEG
jgi:hypothetical protein